MGVEESDLSTLKQRLVADKFEEAKLINCWASSKFDLVIRKTVG